MTATCMHKGVEKLSHVAGCLLLQGGRHVDYVAEQCVAKLMEIIKRKNKDGIKIMPFQVRCWRFCLTQLLFVVDRLYLLQVVANVNCVC